MKQITIQKLSNTKKLTPENALEIIRNTTAGKKATGKTTKKVAAAPKQREKKIATKGNVITPTEVNI